MVLNIDSKIFIVHVAIREQKEMLVHFEMQAQVGALLFDKAPIKILAEYSNYSNVFSAKYVVKLLENIGINKYAINKKKVSNYFLNLSTAWDQ